LFRSSSFFTISSFNSNSSRLIYSSLNSNPSTITFFILYRSFQCGASLFFCCSFPYKAARFLLLVIPLSGPNSSCSTHSFQLSLTSLYSHMKVLVHLFRFGQLLPLLHT